jgi:uncharacterized protein YkwD
VLVLVNAERAKAGCPALTVNPVLVSVAQAHSQDMAERGYFDHTSPEGMSPFDRMRRAGYRGGLMGENIAAGQPTSQAVMRAWMNSPGHRANILNCGYTVIGIGVSTRAGTPSASTGRRTSGTTDPAPCAMADSPAPEGRPSPRPGAGGEVSEDGVSQTGGLPP